MKKQDLRNTVEKMQSEIDKEAKSQKGTITKDKTIETVSFSLPTDK